MALGLKFQFVVLIFVSMFVGACSQKPCRGVELKKPLLRKSEVFDTTVKKDYSQERLWVYKYDGSQQCRMGKPLPPEIMQEQLSGIEVYKSISVNDGLMHITSCGSPTGQANVYWIDKKNKEKALERGFKEWQFRELK
ncbi:MAG: hypothetical protein KDD61_13275 [Bdellovibrionales bacterium]|nr:hypothetical protein [Bdellovibrionales bacterium]